VALVDGEVTAAQFTIQRLADPALLDLVSRTTVIEDPALSAGYPAGIPNRVTVRLTDGTLLRSEVAFPPGHDKNPLTDDQLATKFHGLVDPALGEARAREIWSRLSHLDEDSTPHEALQLLTPSQPVRRDG
jgi:2-methylcitrate dehydratase